MKNETKIYLADVSGLFDEEVFAGYYKTVSQRRQKKTDRMRRREGKCLSLGVELLLKKACEDFGIRYEDEVIVENKYSKPSFSGSNIQFNLSHSGERVMCIMSEHEVGCDVEQTDKANIAIAKRFFSEEEVKQIQAFSNVEAQAECFCRIWTLKESFIKCFGRGLSVPLNEFSILTDLKPAGLIQSIDDFKYSLGEYDARDGYRYSWCIRGEDGDCSIEEVSFGS